jgi:thiamine-phosphate pyrophosphorylase
MTFATASGVSALLAASLRLRARAKPAPGPKLPALFLVTDPDRTPDPCGAARRLPRGCGVIFRAFGASDAIAAGLRLRRIAAERRLVLLVGADPALALAIGADGVHLPERLAFRAGPISRAHPRWIVTAAAHGLRAVLAAQKAGAHAVLLSPALPSRSRSAGRPLGPVRFSALVRSSARPVFALGGVNYKTAPRLLGSGAAGFAAVEALAPRT